MALIEEVFKTSGIPTYTFVHPSEYARLRIALRTPGRGVVVEGPSGIGKTTAVTKALEELGSTKVTLHLSARRKDDRELIGQLPDLQPFNTVVVDDFHRLDENEKEIIADLLKTLADSEDEHSKLIILGINRAGDSLVKLSPDLTNRIEIVKFEKNPEDLVEELVRKGENALNISLNTKDDIIRESDGSFHIAQMLCFRTCLADNVDETAVEHKDVSISFEVVKAQVFEELHRGFSDSARTFATGPRLRKEGRAPYLYMLYWLSKCGDWTLSLDDAYRQHPDQKQSVSQVAEKGYLTAFLDSNPLLKDIIHYDPQTRLLSIEDPKFMFYIKNLLWSKFARDVGYITIDFKSKYDYALSFAGADRSIAQALTSRLGEEEISVFYDKNEQSRILARNVEDYLAPIYRSEAAFVVTLLGPEYPRKVWTKFESEQFKDRFGKNAVIPIWFDSAPPSTFDVSTTVGGFTLRMGEPLQPQIEEISALLIEKLAEQRLEDQGTLFDIDRDPLQNA